MNGAWPPGNMCSEVRENLLPLLLSESLDLYYTYSLSIISNTMKNDCRILFLALLLGGFASCNNDDHYQKVRISVSSDFYETEIQADDLTEPAAFWTGDLLTLRVSGGTPFGDYEVANGNYRIVHSPNVEMTGYAAEENASVYMFKCLRKTEFNELEGTETELIRIRSANADDYATFEFKIIDPKVSWQCRTEDGVLQHEITVDAGNAEIAQVIGKKLSGIVYNRQVLFDYTDYDPRGESSGTFTLPPFEPEGGAELICGSFTESKPAEDSAFTLTFENGRPVIVRYATGWAGHLDIQVDCTDYFRAEYPGETIDRVKVAARVLVGFPGLSSYTPRFY